MMVESDSASAPADSGAGRPCAGCVHVAARYRGITLRQFCTRYKCPATKRCIDYTPRTVTP